MKGLVIFCCLFGFTFTIFYNFFYLMYRRPYWASSMANLSGSVLCPIAPTIRNVFLAFSYSLPPHRRRHVTDTSHTSFRFSRNKYNRRQISIQNWKCHYYLLCFRLKAVMVNALMNYFTSRRRSSAQNGSSDEIEEQDLDGNYLRVMIVFWKESPFNPLCNVFLNHLDVMAPLTNQSSAAEMVDQCLTNKLHRLSLATFDDEGNLAKCFFPSRRRW